MTQSTQKFLGGWSQYWDVAPPVAFTYAIYGMITSLETLTNPGNKSPSTKPIDSSAQKMWAYGGGGCTPQGYPTEEGIQSIVDATVKNGWVGVDFDDECAMNIPNIIRTMQALKQQGKQSSYTFLAGADYVNLGTGEQTIRDITTANCCSRFCLMCYSSHMWSEQDINAYVEKAVVKTIDLVGDRKKVVLALTPAGLNDTNLQQFLDIVIKHDIGGLFVWEFKDLPNQYLDTIITTLGI
ncbi:hypothetical protein [Algicola sagamiensis]|uniref:hypothetical protein n=1 Tax=Algicola sagamiensis TaxID=163869 RepID=UPI000378AA34|nr:hypothetical protein [Algicola sagamiensis]